MIELFGPPAKYLHFWWWLNDIHFPILHKHRRKKSLKFCYISLGHKMITMRTRNFQSLFVKINLQFHDRSPKLDFNSRKYLVKSNTGIYLCTPSHPLVIWNEHMHGLEFYIFHTQIQNFSRYQFKPPDCYCF